MLSRALAVRLLSLGLLILISCQGAPKPATVFCASSMANFVSEVTDHHRLKLRIHSAGSNTLIRQLDSGIRADLVIIADPNLKEKLPKAQSWTQKVIASNRLVIVSSPTQTELDLAELLQNPTLKLAMADPVSAPLGRYSSQVQEKLKIPSRTLLFRNASETLNAVAQGHTDAGIVYRSDISHKTQIRTISEISENDHTAIEYLACLAPDASSEAKELYAKMDTPEAVERLRQAGFLVRD